MQDPDQEVPKHGFGSSQNCSEPAVWFDYMVWFRRLWPPYGRRATRTGAAARRATAGPPQRTTLTPSAERKAVNMRILGILITLPRKLEFLKLFISGPTQQKAPLPYPRRPPPLAICLLNLPSTGHFFTDDFPQTKRDRNKTATSGLVDRNCHGGGHHHHHHPPTATTNASNCGTGKKTKSRSKSRSPGRELDRAIVIVHHTTCTHQSVRSRGNSPDNLSESSISFHENEVISDIQPNPVPRPVEGGHPLPEPPVWYDGPMDPCVSVSRDPLPLVRGSGEGGRVLRYSNWESCRESWFSSGSDCPRPSSGSDCPPQPPYLREKEVGARMATAQAPSTLPRVGGRVGGGGLGGTMRQSSRESGSSSSRQSSRPNTRTNNR